MFFAMAMSFYWVFDTSRKKCIQLTGIGIGGVFGVGSEFVQSIAVPTRRFDIFDILANVVGVGLAVFVAQWYHTRLIERKRAQRFEMLNSGSTASTTPAAASTNTNTDTPTNNGPSGTETV